MLFNAFRVFSAIALVLGLLGLVYGTAVAVKQGLGFPVLAAMLGLIGDQVSALRLEQLEDRSGGEGHGDESTPTGI